MSKDDQELTREGRNDTDWDVFDLDDTPLRPDPTIVPQTLRERNQWLVARKLHPEHPEDKRPLEPVDPTALTELMTFDMAIERAESLRDDSRLITNGDTIVGFTLRPDDEILGWDLDNVRNPIKGDESIPDSVWRIVNTVGGFWQVSISGTGLRGFSLLSNSFVDLLDERTSKAELPIGSVVGNKPAKIEVYPSGQYLSVSGFKPLTDSGNGQTYNRMHCNSAGTRKIIEEYLPQSQGSSSQSRPSMNSVLDTDNFQRPTNKMDDESGDSSLSLTSLGKRRAKNWTSGSKSNGGTSGAEAPKSVRQVIETALEKGGDDFQRLWRGEDIKNDDSNSDRYFLLKLAFWTQKDRTLMAEAFRRSGRYNCRDDLPYVKFDSKRHGKTGIAWGEYEIDKAIEDQSDEFTGQYLSIN